MALTLVLPAWRLLDACGRPHAITVVPFYTTLPCTTTLAKRIAQRRPPKHNHDRDASCLPSEHRPALPFEWNARHVRTSITDSAVNLTQLAPSLRWLMAYERWYTMAYSGQDLHTMENSQRCCREMTPVGFEPTQLALVELESTPLDHSGKVS